MGLEQVHVAQIEGVEIGHRHREAFHFHKTLIENQFRFFKIEDLESQLLVNRINSLPVRCNRYDRRIVPIQVLPNQM